LAFPRSVQSSFRWGGAGHDLERRLGGGCSTCATSAPSAAPTAAGNRIDSENIDENFEVEKQTVITECPTCAGTGVEPAG
jgi:hypothetical protein